MQLRKLDKLSQEKGHDMSTLNSNYATLCSFSVPVTALLFGDVLQAQLNHIPALNKINNTASAAGYSGAHSRQYKYREQKSQK